MPARDNYFTTKHTKNQSNSRECQVSQARVNLSDISLVIEPIRLIGWIPCALGHSVTSLLLSETSQDLRGLGCVPALTRSRNECFFGIGRGTSRAILLASPNRRSA